MQDRARNSRRRANICIEILRFLYRNCKTVGKDISKAYRKSLESEDDVALTYGEVLPASFIQILQLTVDYNKSKLSNGRVFVDLGSGVGKACFSAALAPLNFTKVWGIEIIDEMTEQAKELKNSLLLIIENSLAAHSSSTVTTKNPSHDLQPVNDSSGHKLHDAIKNILLKSDSMSLSTDELGNQLCKALGRKEYRQQIKLVKSLENFLRNHCLAAVDVNAGDESTLSLHFDPNMSKVYLRNTLKDGFDKPLSTEDVPIIGDAAVLPTRKLNDEEIVEGGKKLESSDKELSFHLSKEDAQLLLPCPEMIFETGDIFEVVWWTEADVAYAASLLFSDSMMQRLTEKVLLMKPGAWFISLKPLILHMKEQQEMVLLRSESFFRMSWQMAKVFVYQRC